LRSGWVQEREKAGEGDPERRGLRSEGLVDVAQDVKLPLLVQHRDVELGELLLPDEDWEKRNRGISVPR